MKHISWNNCEEFVSRGQVNCLQFATDVYFNTRWATDRARARLRVSDYNLQTCLLEEFQRKSFNHQLAIKDLDCCEYNTILDLNKHDAAIEIQRIFRGNDGRLIAHGYDMCAWYDAYDAATCLQSAWRRYKLRNELILRKALREIDLRLCRARYARVIAAAGVIHKAWANHKLAKRMRVMVGEQRRKAYAHKHGLDDLFAGLLDLAIKVRPSDPLSFVSTRMIRMKGKKGRKCKPV